LAKLVIRLSWERNYLLLVLLQLLLVVLVEVGWVGLKVGH
jgi:hypothetical protein